MAWVAPLVGCPLGPNCTKPVMQQFDYGAKIMHHMRNLNHAFKRLSAKRKDILLKLEAAEGRQEACTNDVKNWLDDVREIEEKISNIQEDYDKWERSQLVCPTKCWTRYRIGKRAFKKRDKVERLIEQADKFPSVAEKLPPERCQKFDIPEPVGMMSYLERVLSYLRDDNVRMIGIHGVGGIGKTFLLQLINNMFLKNGDGDFAFDYVIMLVVSQDYKPESLQKDLSDRLHLPLEKDAKASISTFLRSKNFLLLLDDLWADVDLINTVGIPHNPISHLFERKKHKVVFATRSSDVCSRMGPQKSIPLDVLKDDDPWRLFYKTIGTANIPSNEVILSIAKEVAIQCGGLPLSIVTVAQAMRNKTIEEWRCVERSMRNPQTVIRGLTDAIYPKLKISYDTLQQDTTKRCFLYCSLWPANDSIDNDELIQCWMGLGLLDQEFPDIIEASDWGHFHIARLKEASLLQTGDNVLSQVRMLRPIQGLALSIAREISTRNNWIVQSRTGLKEAPEAAEWIGAEVISLMHNDIEVLPRSLDCPKLRVLILRGNLLLKDIPGNFFDKMRNLIYLDLSHTGIEEVPAKLGKLAKLQYLDLSHTPISELPKELKSLKSLKFLHLYGTEYLRTIPRAVMCGFTQLRVLDLTGSGYAYCWKGSDVTEQVASIQKLKFLEGQEKSLGITMVSLPAFEFLSKLSLVSKSRLPLISVWRLWLQGFPLIHKLSPLKLLMSSHIRDSLKVLEIRHCMDLIKLKMEIDSNRSTEGCFFPRLEILHLLSLQKLRKIVWKGVNPHELLRNLRDIKICYCNELNDVTWILRLPLMQHLELRGCKKMKVVIDTATDAKTTFPSLKIMVLHKLPELTKICDELVAFPYLESLQISACPNLNRLPFGLGIINSKFRKLEGEKQWWDNIQWNDSVMRTFFHGRFYFIPSIICSPPPPPAPLIVDRVSTAAMSSYQKYFPIFFIFMGTMSMLIFIFLCVLTIALWK